VRCFTRAPPSGVAIVCSKGSPWNRNAAQRDLAGYGQTCRAILAAFDTQRGTL
jgi:hypothetical protein